MNSMKKYWNYIFYFTWILHSVLGKRIIEKPFRHILNFVPFFANNLKKGEKDYRNIMDNPEYGFDIGFAYNCMLTTTAVIIASLEICIFFSFNTGLSQIVQSLFGVVLGEDVNAIAFFSSAIGISFLLNEILLKWFKGDYMEYFKEFNKINNRKAGYSITIFFHFGSALFLLFSILHFDV